MRKLGAVNDANYCDYMEHKLWVWYRRFPPKQAAADSAADVAAEISAPEEAEALRVLPLQPMQLLKAC
jgi:hypothetical protein